MQCSPRLSIALRTTISLVFSITLVCVLAFAVAPRAQASPGDLVLEVFVGNGSTSDAVLQLGLAGEITNATIDWGDGGPGTAIPNQPSGTASALFTHTYPNTSNVAYQVTITATKIESFGACGGLTAPWNLTKVLQWGSVGITNLECAFYDRSQLTYVPPTLPTGVTTLKDAFRDAHIFDQDLSGWNTSAVTDMSHMFELAYAFNNGAQPLTWNTSNVLDMSYMFKNANQFDGSLASFDVSNVTDMTDMFATIFPHLWSFSDANYSATLEAWASQSVQANVQLNAPENKATGCAAVAARTTLLNAPNSWTISDIAPTDVVPAGGCNAPPTPPSPPTPSGTSALPATGSNTPASQGALVWSLAAITSGVGILALAAGSRRWLNKLTSIS